MFDYRAATLADAPAICELYRRSEAFDRVPRVLELDELIEELESDAVDLADGSLVALANDQIVGVAYLYFRPSQAVEQRCHIFGQVDPEWRGRGVGTALLRWGTDRATSVLRSIEGSPEVAALPRFIRVDAYDYIEPAVQLATDMGFQPVRYFDELLRPLADLPEPVTVEGLRIEAWPEDRDEEIRIVKNTAFLDHWGSVPSTADGWRGQIHGYGARLDLSFVAVDAATDQVVAMLFTVRYESDDELLGRSDAWIQTLGTLREWRGHGVGSALIVAALHAYADAGLTHASIGVDSENPSGAARLYRHLGFEQRQRVITLQIALPS